MDIVKTIFNACLSVDEAEKAKGYLDDKNEPGLTTPLGQAEFEHVLDAMSAIRKVKIDQYGEGRLQLHRGQEVRDVTMAYSDVHRKYVRLDQQIFSGQLDLKNLVETFTDLAVYSAQAVQILGRLIDARDRNRSE